MATIKEIAKIAGVSIGTVSKVLNNDSKVKEKSRKKIIKVIKELNYKPSKIARSLSKGKTKNIGFIIPDITNPFFSELMKSATDMLMSKGYYVFLCNSDNNPDKEEFYINDLISMWVDGIILAPSKTKRGNISVLSKVILPIVIVDREIEGLNKDSVIINNKDGAYKVVNYLIKKGHKKIAVITGDRDTNTAEKRYLGWELAMKKNNLFDKNLIFWGKYSIDSGYVMMKKIYNSLSLVDAVFACNDLIAIGAIQAIKDKKYKIPDDISIVGFDDIYLGKFLNPPLTTVRQPIYKMGKIIAQILLDRIDNSNQKFTPKKVIINGELIIRDSVAERS